MKHLLSLVVLASLAVTACGGTDSPADPVATLPIATGRVELTALAGPVCPVETDPPSPDCAPRPVPDAVIVVTAADGSEVARGTTSADGTIMFDLPSGELTITPQAVGGLLGTPPPISVSVIADLTISLTADYDTGIR